VTPSIGQIRAQVAAVLERDERAAAIGIFAGREFDWPAELDIGERRFALRWCDSPLAARLALHDARVDHADGTVILTPLAENELGADVLARLARGQVFRVKHWDIVRTAFQAYTVEARLGEHGWMADLLIERMPAQGYAPAPSGILDAETAWRTLMQVTLGLDGARPDGDALLAWTTRPNAMERWLALPDKARAGISSWLEGITGAAGALVLAVVATGYGRDAVPLGLIAEVLFGEDAQSAELAAIAVRVERYTAGKRLDRVAGLRWAEAAVRVVRNLDRDAARPLLARADQLSAELYLAPFAGLGSTLPSGFEARLSECSRLLRQFVAEPSTGVLRALEQASARVREHALAAAAPARVERVTMATRLARWMLATPPRLTGLDAHIGGYVASGAFVDWARLKLLGGDEIADLSSAFDLLAAKVQERRETLNHSFAEALKAWNDTGSTSGAVLPVERILDAVVAPLAESAPVLVLVVDGLSMPVFAELADDLARLGWTALTRDTGPWPGAAIAAIPTVTEISRASLLAGRLVAGGQQLEKTAFAEHPALVARTRPAIPTLFHKGELGEGLGLSERVREAVGKQAPRIVGVVYNAIDDQLDGATQIHLRWSLDDLRMLPALLHEARGAGRALVLTADHGHIIEHTTTVRAGTDGDRWRRPDGSLKDDEIAIQGGRVLSPSGANSVVMPWSESVRYGAKKNGYHGGASLQEVVVPLCVLAPTGMLLPGWRPLPSQCPDWWQGQPLAPLVAPAVLAPASAPARAKPATPQPDLFSAPVATPVPALAPAQPGDWIAELLTSTTYQTQRAMAARVAPEDTDMRRLLEALAERGGKLSKSVVATRLALSPLRLSGFLSAARRVLNVDQSAVIVVDEATDTVELNLNLLRVQFALSDPQLRG
jgi:hypothetical protein